MLSPLVLQAWLDSMEEMSYYAILKVPQTSAPEQIKAAFHRFALSCHPDQYVDAPEETSVLAADVFKRGVEAYTILSRPELRKRYDEAMLKGKLRIDVHAVAPAKPQPAPARTLEAIAQDPQAKVHALKADRLIGIGQLEQARLELATAIQCDPFNDELKAAMTKLYEMIAHR